jgi:hypothetical protein
LTPVFFFGSLQPLVNLDVLRVLDVKDVLVGGDLEVDAAVDSLKKVLFGV